MIISSQIAEGTGEICNREEVKTNVTNMINKTKALGKRTSITKEGPTGMRMDGVTFSKVLIELTPNMAIKAKEECRILLELPPCIVKPLKTGTITRASKGHTIKMKGIKTD